MMQVKKLLPGLILAGATMIPALAFAESKQITVPRGQAAPVLAIMTYGGGTCEVFPVRDVRVASGPAHGVAQVMQVSTKLSERTGVCAGTAAKVPVVVYKSAGSFTGVDHVTVTWMSPSHTDNVRMVPEEMNIQITVK